MMTIISSKRYLAILMATFLALFISNTITTWLIGIPKGDLVRIGKYSENQFSYQTIINTPINNSDHSASEIIVLGDSFSRPHLWQEELGLITNKSITTYDYHDVGCPTNFFTWIKQESKPKVLIIQVVERMFPQFSETRGCNYTAPKTRKAEIPENFKNTSKTSQLFQQDIFFNISATLNTFKSQHDKSITSGKVINSPLSREDLFSNPKANRLLYLKDDLNKFKWSKEGIESSIDGLLNLKKDLETKKIKLIIVVVPDKLSVYEDDLLEGPQQASSIHERLLEHQLSPLNLKTEFKKTRLYQKNLYAPNDSHLSAEGYKHLGRLLAKTVRY